MYVLTSYLCFFTSHIPFRSFPTRSLLGYRNQKTFMRLKIQFSNKKVWNLFIQFVLRWSVLFARVLHQHPDWHSLLPQRERHDRSRQQSLQIRPESHRREEWRGKSSSHFNYLSLALTSRVTEKLLIWHFTESCWGNCSNWIRRLLEGLWRVVHE